MKKFIFTFLMAIVINSTLYSQIQNMVDSYILDEVHRNTFIDNKGSMLDISKIIGSPYKDDDFVQGSVFIEEFNQKIVASLRYNIYNDEMEFIDPKDNSIRALVKKEGLIYTIGVERFIYLNTNNLKNIKAGYYKVLVLNKEFASLFVKIKCIYIPEKPAATTLQQGTEAEFKIKTINLILVDGEMNILKANKKKILRLFSVHQNKLSKYISENKLNMKEERHLLRLISYYNTLM